jgi:hypothetical protein
MDLSRKVPAQQPERSLILRDAGSGWADFGNPTPVIDTLVRDGMEPAWLGQLRQRAPDLQWTIQPRMRLRP